VTVSAPTAGSSAERVPDDLERRHRERHADRELGQADPASRHQPPVAGQGEYATPGDGMPIDRCHRRPRVVEDGPEHPRQRGQEVGRVRGAAVEDAAQVDARGEGGPGAGDQQGAVGRRHRGGEGVEQFGVHGVDPAVLHAQDGDVVALLDVQHPAILDRPERPRRPMACFVLAGVPRPRPRR
jgi:hypothetical protein